MKKLVCIRKWKAQKGGFFLIAAAFAPIATDFIGKKWKRQKKMSIKLSSTVKKNHNS